MKNFIIHRNILKKFNFFNIFVFLLLLSSFFPPFRALPFFNLIWPMLLVLILCYLFFFKKIKINIYIICSILFFFYVIVISFVSDNFFLSSRFLEYFQIIVFYLAFKNNTRENNLFILSLLSPFIILVSIKTLLGIQESVNIARLAKKDTEIGVSYMMDMIGGYDYIYMLVFLSLILFYLIFYSNFFKNKIIISLILVMFFFNILLSNFMISLLLFLIGSLLVIYTNKISFFKIIFLIFFAIILFYNLNYLIMSIIDFLVMNIFKDSMNASRLLEIKEVILYNVIDDSLSARLDAYKLSLNAFLDNFLFGLIISGNLLNALGELTSFGQHSFFFDSFALFGVFFGFLQVFIIAYPFLIRFDKSLINLSLPIFVISILFLTLNNLTPSIGFILFFVYPIIYEELINLNKGRSNVH